MTGQIAAAPRGPLRTGSRLGPSRTHPAVPFRCRSVPGPSRPWQPFRRPRPPGGGHARGVGDRSRGGAAPAALVMACWMPGTTMPLSRSIAWPTPSWLAALVGSPMMPPGFDAAGALGRVGDRSPRIG